MQPEPAVDAAVISRTPYVDPSFVPILMSMYIDYFGEHHFCLQTGPILTGYLTNAEADRMSHHPFYQDHIHVMASALISYSSTVYGFNSGHFLPFHHQTPINVPLAANTRTSSRALFKQFTQCPLISNSAEKI